MLDEDELIYDKQINYLAPRIHYTSFKKTQLSIGLNIYPVLFLGSCKIDGEISSFPFPSYKFL